MKKMLLTMIVSCLSLSALAAESTSANGTVPAPADTTIEQQVPAKVKAAKKERKKKDKRTSMNLKAREKTHS